MAVQYYNGQYFDVMPATSWLYAGGASSGYSAMPGINGYAKALSPPTTGNPAPAQQNSGMYGDPFGTAMSGGKSGTLQPFINRNTGLANNALYGGLLGYQPQKLVAGDAGGTPMSPDAPQWKLPSAIPNINQAQVGLLGPQAADYRQQEQPIFGNRAWMEY